MDGADRNVLLVPERGAGLPQPVKVMLLANGTRLASHRDFFAVVVLPVANRSLAATAV